MTAAPEARTNAQGFPLVTCYRCKGSGEFSFNRVTGKVCFGCGGTGWCIRRGKASTAWKAYQEAVAAAGQKPWAEVSVGEAVKPFWDRPRKVVTVESIEADTLNPGHIIVRFSSGGTLGTQPDFTVALAVVDPARLPDPAEFTKGL